MKKLSANVDSAPLESTDVDVGGCSIYSDIFSSPPIPATLGALVTTWTTFEPCFLWIFLGGPYIEKLRGNETVSSGNMIGGSVIAEIA